MVQKQKVKTALGAVLQNMDQHPGAAPLTREETVGQEKRSRDLMGMLGGKTESEVIREVAPERCRLWAHHNRLYNLLTLDNCQDLVDSIRAEGQIEPVVARKLPNDPSHDFEIIAGARRLWVCTYLGRPLRLTIKDLDDREAFLFSEASNRYSDISAYERAIEYKHALESYFNGNQSEFAASIGRSVATISRYKALWELEPELVRAYPDPRQITPTMASTLRTAMDDQKKRAALLRAAAECGENPSTPALSAAAITKQLISETKATQKQPMRALTKSFTNERGKVYLTAKMEKGGVISVRVPKNNGSSQGEIVEAFEQALAELLGGKESAE